MVSDGAQEVGEALGWLGRKLLWARCGFHLMREVRAKVDRKAWGEIRKDLRGLRGLRPGEREAFFWKELLPPPWTNNVAEVGHGRLWRRRTEGVAEPGGGGILVDGGALPDAALADWGKEPLGKAYGNSFPRVLVEAPGGEDRRVNRLFYMGPLAKYPKRGSLQP